MSKPNPPHQWLLNIQPDAKQSFDQLPASEKRSAFRHLRELLNADDPYNLPFVEMLKAERFGRARKFRVGNHRVFFAVEVVRVTDHNHAYKGTLFILAIRDRKDAY